MPVGYGSSGLSHHSHSIHTSLASVTGSMQYGDSGGGSSRGLRGGTGSGASRIDSVQANGNNVGGQQLQWIQESEHARNI